MLSSSTYACTVARWAFERVLQRVIRKTGRWPVLHSMHEEKSMTTDSAEKRDEHAGVNKIHVYLSQQGLLKSPGLRIYMHKHPSIANSKRKIAGVRKLETPGACTQELLTYPTYTPRALKSCKTSDDRETKHKRRQRHFRKLPTKARRLGHWKRNENSFKSKSSSTPNGIACTAANRVLAMGHKN